MNKTVKFLFITFWIILSRVYDAYCTYQFTPDLDREANPLVSILGLGWTPLLIIIGLLLFYIIYTYYKSVYQEFDFLPTEKGLSFSTFLSFIYLGRKAHWTTAFFQAPNSAERFHFYIGNVLSKALVFAGIVSTIMWLLINYTDWYLTDYHSAAVIYAILIVGTIAIVFFWNKELYKKYLAGQ